MLGFQAFKVLLSGWCMSKLMGSGRQACQTDTRFFWAVKLLIMTLFDMVKSLLHSV